ncbi:MAG: glycosyltransferase family 2 protein [Ruminococcaceae bacterium]|nr:glycosyltransferase family 2 protein [Oscillospiraceae bacterium]
MKVIVATWAYNAEQTIERAINSVLSQSYTNLIYYLIDNGSCDGTGAIIRKYAGRDKRIIPITCQCNDPYILGKITPEIAKQNEDEDYFCNLDADDEYLPEFLEKSLAFMKKYDLDAVASGSYYSDAKTGECIGQKKAEQQYILTCDNIDKVLPAYYPFVRTIWGKLYKNKTARYAHQALMRQQQSDSKIIYGSDTYFCLQAFTKADRIGILPECLHKYYISTKSASYRFTEGRIRSDRILFDTGCDFLIKKAGSISKTNQDFLLAVYLFALRDTLRVLMNSQNSLQDKLAGVLDIYSNVQTRKLIKEDILVTEKEQLFHPMGQWVSEQKDAFSDAEMADFVKQTGLSIFQQRPLPVDRTFQMLVHLKREAPDSEIINDAFAAVASAFPLLVGAKADFLLFLADPVREILRGEPEQALEKIEILLEQEAEIPDAYAEPLITLGLNLSAQLSRNADFIYFKKLQISVFFAFSKTQEALKELGNWDALMPEDADFQNLRQALDAASAQK